MIFVTVGTHHQPFRRLLEAVDAMAAAGDERVVVQCGSTVVDLPHCDTWTEVAPAQLDAWLREASVVVMHAGSSSFLQARALGRIPIIVPRRPEHGEHVDDHQVRFAATLGDEALVVEPSELAAAVRDHEEPCRSVDPEARSVAFCQRFGVLAGALVSGSTGVDPLEKDVP